MSSLSHFLSSPSKFDPFAFESETPPPAAVTFSQSSRNHQGSDMPVCHLPNPQGPSLRHQQRSFNGFPSSNSLGTWIYDPDFGFIHTGTCSVCTAYAEHIIAARKYKDTSIAEAIKARKDDQDLSFLNGYRLGVSQTMGENQSLRKELERFRWRCANLEEDYGYLRRSLADQKNSINSPATSIPPSYTGSAGSHSPSASSTNSFAEFRMHGITFASPGSRAMEMVSVEKSQAQVEKPPQRGTTYASVASTHAPRASPPISRASIFSNVTIQPSNARPGPAAAFRVRRDKQGRPKFPKTTHELKDLMSLAGEPTTEGTLALSIVKKMCLDAHATPREEKTPLQKWTLMNWRNPYAPANTSLCQIDAKPNPRIDDPVDVWFDYLCTHPHSWPKGVRKDSKGKPVMSDLIANRAVARMRPTESATVRNDFIAQVTDMFSSPGMYQQLLEKHGFTVAPRVTYNVFTGPITVDRVALHFAKSGITPNDATNNFEPWAKHYGDC